MEKSKDNKAWSDWDLESTAQILFKKFPRSFIWIIRSSVFDRGTFACYSNFIEMDACGTPVFERADSTALLHLQRLLDSAVRKGKYILLFKHLALAIMWKIQMTLKSFQLLSVIYSPLLLRVTAPF